MGRLVSVCRTKCKSEKLKSLKRSIQYNISCLISMIFHPNYTRIYSFTKISIFIIVGVIFSFILNLSLL